MRFSGIMGEIEGKFVGLLKHENLGGYRTRKLWDFLSMRNFRNNEEKFVKGMSKRKICGKFQAKRCLGKINGKVCGIFEARQFSGILRTSYVSFQA